MKLEKRSMWQDIEKINVNKLRKCLNSILIKILLEEYSDVKKMKDFLKEHIKIEKIYWALWHKKGISNSMAATKNEMKLWTKY